MKVFSAFDRDKRAQLLKEVETLWGMECPSLISFVGGYLKVLACLRACVRPCVPCVQCGAVRCGEALMH